jgi:competence protein ComEC
LTHAHQDHLGGLTAVLDNFQVGRLWIGRVEHELRGKSFSWDGVEGSILWPENATDDVAPSAKNDDSLVLGIKYGGLSLLLPGDAEKEAERESWRRTMPARCRRMC